jgi:hypothetical protein
MSLVNVSLGEASVLVPAQPKEMISVTPMPSGKTKVRINSSSISVIQECLRKSQYLLEEKWRQTDESPATLFGSAVHKALEVFYSSPFELRGELPTLNELETLIYDTKARINITAIEAAVLAFAHKAAPLAALPDDNKRSVLNGIWILHNYFKAYANDPFVAYIDKDGPFVERAFTYQIHEDDNLIIDTFGTIDCVLQHRIDKSLYVTDHKTTSALNFNNQSYFERDKPCHQYSLYMLGAQKVYGIDTANFIVNVINVKAKPKTARGSAPDFPRQITTRTEEDFAELKEVVLKTVNDYLYAKKHGVWPMGPLSACNSYGACSYKQICASPKELRYNVLKSKFVQAKNA